MSNEIKSLIFWIPENRFPPSLNKKLLLGWKPTLGSPPVAMFYPKVEIFHKWSLIPNDSTSDEDFLWACECPLGELCEAPKDSLYKRTEERWELPSDHPALGTSSASGLVLVWEGKIIRPAIDHAEWFLNNQIKPNEWTSPSGVLEIASRLKAFLPKGMIVVNGKVVDVKNE